MITKSLKPKELAFAFTTEKNEDLQRDTCIKRSRFTISFFTFTFLWQRVTQVDREDEANLVIVFRYVCDILFSF